MSFILNLIITVAQFQDLVAIRDNLQIQSANLKSQIDATNQELELLKKRLEETTNRIIEPQYEIDLLKDRLEKLKSEQNINPKTTWRFNREIAAINAKIETYMSQISYSTVVLNETLIIYEDVKNRINDLNKRFETINSQIGTLNVLIETITSQFE